MANDVKTYLLVPGWDFPAGSIYLGSVILDPSQPHRNLNKVNPTAIDSPIHSSNKFNFKETLHKSTNRKIGLWAQFLQIFGLGAELSVQYDKGLVDEYSFERMKTEWFLPSQEFIEMSIKAPRVAELLEQLDYKRPIYIITGLKTVEGARVTTTRSKGRTFHGKVGVDGTSTATPVSVGPEGDYSTKTSDTASFASSSPIVFAFQLVKVKCKEKSITQWDYTEGALFSDDEDQMEVVIEEAVGANSAPDNDRDVISVVDEDGGEVCQCVIPESS